MSNSFVWVLWFSFIADSFAIICIKNYENGTQFYHLDVNSCSKKESQSCTYINVKHGGLVIMDIKYMFKTYEAFPYVVYPDPLLQEVAAL